MVLERNSGAIEHRCFNELARYLKAGDVLVLNDSRVIPARLKGRKAGSSTEAEILLLRRLGDALWEALVRPGRRLGIGEKIELADGKDGARLIAEVVGRKPDGVRIIAFSGDKLLPQLGEMPLPPYIHTPLADPERYQTVYASIEGSVAAPTAGLHFTQKTLEELKQKGVKCLFVTLHVGLFTFRPVRLDDPTEHRIHQEYGILSREVAAELSGAKAEGRRIICVGTTTVRLVEQVAQLSSSAHLEAFSGWVGLFILPGYQFRFVVALLTNFHLPRSTLLMLVSAFAGKELIDRAYQEAIAWRYRFYSFGDAMLVL